MISHSLSSNRNRTSNNGSNIMSEHDLTLSDLEGLDIDDFDSAEYLSNEQAIAAYLTEALASNDASMLAVAVGNVARARGMTEIAKASGLAREGLYKALRPNSQPRMETITRVLGALGVRLVAEVIPLAERVIEPAFAPMNLPKGAVLTEKPARQTYKQAVLASGKAARATKAVAKAVAAKAPAKTIAKVMAKPAVAKPPAKRPVAKPAAKRTTPTSRAFNG
jgi:probable addiction module antidote protein